MLSRLDMSARLRRYADGGGDAGDSTKPRHPVAAALVGVPSRWCRPWRRRDHIGTASIVAFGYAQRRRVHPQSQNLGAGRIDRVREACAPATVFMACAVAFAW
jgi:hypothetical protein